MILIIFILILILIVIRLMRIPYYKKDTNIYYNPDHTNKLYVSMTTVPDRVRTEWFYNNIKRMIDFPGNFIILLNVPYVSGKGEPYVISNQLSNLQCDKFKIIYCGVDEGPITKILPTLRNSDIPDDGNILVIDDDVIYKPNIFVTMTAATEKHTNSVCVFCRGARGFYPLRPIIGKYTNLIEGYKGFGFKKRVLNGLLDINIPDSCRRIDDDVISLYVRRKGIQVVSVPYDNDVGNFCTWEADNSKGRPEWSELCNDNRAPMIRQCRLDINI